jgi:biotin synthase
LIFRNLCYAAYPGSTSAGRTENGREGYDVRFFCRGEFTFCIGDKHTTPNPGCKTTIWNVVGFRTNKPFVKKYQPETVEADASQFQTMVKTAMDTSHKHILSKSLCQKKKAKLSV